MTDFFPGFDSVTSTVDGVELFARVGGPADGAAVVLLHGFPQSHLCWHMVAPTLATRFRVVCLDLKGYGRSQAAPGDPDHVGYSKRTMAAEVVAFMAALGHDRFSVVGHDRGALVGYRLALDTPEAVDALVICDNYPTPVIWDNMAVDPNFTPHWRAFAAEGTDAEDAMAPDLLEKLVAAHTASGTVDELGDDVMNEYRSDWRDPARIHAYCEDYRAGAGIDPQLDRADLAAGRAVTCPALVIWGEAFLGKAPESTVDVWRRTFAPHIVGVEVPGGHFNPEESPAETTAALMDFLSDHAGTPAS